MDVGILSLFSSALVAVVASVCWIEKRFRDSRKELDTCVSDEEKSRVAAINAVTADLKQATAHLERQQAVIMRDLAQIQLTIARELRDYPTKVEIQGMLEIVTEQIDKLEARIERFMDTRGRITQ